MTTVGAIRYLNALPLVAHLAEQPAIDQVRYEIPSLLASGLRNRSLDVALVPQVESARDPSYRWVTDYCIACRGAVESILLFTEKPWEDLQRVGVDLSSNSSVEMLKVLMHRRTGRIPECIAIPPRLDALRSEGEELDAVLLIGDRALAEDRGEIPRWDLGEVWFEETGLPFVFAVWLGREGIEPDVVAGLSAAARIGLENRASLARAFCREHPDVSAEAAAVRYLSEVIHYELGPDERESLRFFHEQRVAAGLLEAGSPAPQPWRPFAADSPENGASA